MSMRCLLAPHAPGCDQVDDTAGTTSAHATESELGGDLQLGREIAVDRIALVERVCKPWPKAAIQCHLLPFAAAKSSGSSQSHPWAEAGRRVPSYRHLVVRNRQAGCRLVPRPKAAIQCHLLPFAAAKSSGSSPSHPWAKAGRRPPSYRNLVVRNRQAGCRLVPRPKAAIQCHLLPFSAAKSSGSLPSHPRGQSRPSTATLRTLGRAKSPGSLPSRASTKSCHPVPFMATNSSDSLQSFPSPCPLRARWPVWAPGVENHERGS